jgi:hypothetical protein
MRTIKILPNLLPINRPQFMESSNGHFDYIGQILHQLGYNVSMKRLPSDLGIVIPPFTTSVRRRIIDSKLTLDILALDILPTKELQLTKLKSLLAPYFDIKVIYTYVDAVTLPEDEAADESDLSDVPFA